MTSPPAGCPRQSPPFASLSGGCAMESCGAGNVSANHFKPLSFARCCMPIGFVPPAVLDPTQVGEYPAMAKAGGGYVWDEVLEYRVWCHPERSTLDGIEGSDYYHAFETFEEALAFATSNSGCEAPLALVLQREYIDESEPGQYVHVAEERITEWPVEFLGRPRRTERTIPDFMSPDAPPNRLAILRGQTR